MRIHNSIFITYVYIELRRHHSSFTSFVSTLTCKGMLRQRNDSLTLAVLSMLRRPRRIVKRCHVQSKNGLRFIVDLVDGHYQCPLCVQHQTQFKKKFKVHIWARSSTVSTMTKSIRRNMWLDADQLHSLNESSNLSAVLCTHMEKRTGPSALRRPV